MSPPVVYAIMITGKDERRVMFARLIGLKNFDMQDYPHKKLIIINHGTIPILTTQRQDVYEIFVDKSNMTLGDLRNFALELVPLNGIWICWDDDDFRTSNYMSFMLNHLLSSNSIAVFMKNRLEYNLANGFTFRSSFKDGNTHIMSIKLDKLRYIPKDTLEDVFLREQIKSFKKKYVSIDNDPKMYIRIIHQNNTSPFVTDERKEVIRYSEDSYYREFDVTQEQKAFVQQQIQQHYGMFVYKKLIS